MIRRLRILLLAGVGAALVACSGTGVASISQPPGASLTIATPTPTAASEGPTEAQYDIGGYSLWMACSGSGSPTVVFEAGLDAAHEAWLSVYPRVAKVTRACWYDRAGVGRSHPRPERTSTAGKMADELFRLVGAAGIHGPLILAGHSYGGMIVRLAAHAHPELVAGLVLVDSASEHQTDKAWAFYDDHSYDGVVKVDQQATGLELSGATNLGAIPIVVLTRGQMNGAFEADWSRFQDELARLSTNSLHLVASKAGHSIQEDDPDLVVEAIIAAVDAVRTGSSLPSCGPRFQTLGAECVATTMTDELATWAALRATVKPTAGAFPAGTYREVLTGAQAEAITGDHQDFTTQILTWTIGQGTWSLTVQTDGGTPEKLGDVYAAVGDEVTFRWPEDSRIPRTPGVNRLRWTVDPDGTVHLTQVDAELPEPAFSEPLQPMK